MKRALATLALAALLLDGCGSGGVPHRTWVAHVCQTLGPWRDRITTLNGQAGTQMKAAKTPAQTRANLVELLDGAGKATEEARAKVAATGVPDVTDGAAIAHRFATALAQARDAYAKASSGIKALPEQDPTAFYAGVKSTMDTLTKEYAQAGVDTGKLASAQLRKDFDEVPECA